MDIIMAYVGIGVIICSFAAIVYFIAMNYL